jgi:hypothetical protein
VTISTAYPARGLPACCYGSLWQISNLETLVRRSTTHGGNGGSSHRREESELRSGQYPVLCLCFPLSSEGSDIWNWGFRLKHDCCYKLIDRHWHPKDKCKHRLTTVVKYAWTFLNPGRQFAGCPKVMASWLPAYVVHVVNDYF